MDFIEKLKILANGINPETGEVLGRHSLTGKPETIRILYSLADELSLTYTSKVSKTKLSPQEKKAKNIAEGKPEKSHFPWEEAEKVQLIKKFKAGISIEKLSVIFKRSPLAVAAQLHKLEFITEEKLASYRKS